MLREFEELCNAKTLFKKDERGLHLTNKFLDLGDSLTFNEYFSEEQKVLVEILFKHVWQDISNLSVLVERIDWLRREAITGTISDDKWRDYTRIDIEHFHAELRSTLDYVNTIISYFSKRHGQWPGSYNRTLERIDSFKHKIPEDVYVLIKKRVGFLIYVM